MGRTSEVGVSGMNIRGRCEWDNIRGRCEWDEDCTSEVGVSGTNIRGRCEWDEDPWLQKSDIPTGVSKRLGEA